MFVIATTLAIPADSAADVFGFSCITNNSPTDCAVLEAQIQMEVTAVGGTQVRFDFTNTGGQASSIADVYFDDQTPPLLGTPVTIINSAGVSFSAGCSPGNLPGGAPYGFTSSYCADSDSPVQPNGVNPGETLSLIYTLQGTSTFADVIAALNSDDYVVGVHVQGFANGGSEAGVSTPRSSVPEPSTLLLSGLGLFGLAARRRRT
jgi:PEP-CTERM motif-containing protein